MKRVASICLIAAMSWILGGTSTQAQDQSSQRQGKFHRHQPGRVFSPNAFKVQYLGVDGAHTADCRFMEYSNSSW